MNSKDNTMTLSSHISPAKAPFTKMTAVIGLSLLSLLCLLSFESHAQGFNDALKAPASNPLTTSIQANNNLQNDAPQASTLDDLNTGEEFLLVSEAYQLSAKTSDDTLTFGWVIADAYYLYGEQFKVTANSEDLVFSKPAGKIAYDQVFEKDLEKHYTYVELTVGKDQFIEGQATQIDIHSQGCADAGLCYPPQVQSFKLSPNLASLMPMVDPRANRFKNASASTSNNIVTESTPTTDSSASFALSMIAFALIGGLILNLMPCVLPVLSLKALSLSSGHSNTNQKRHGWSYTIGVITTFVLIASVLLIVRAAGQAVGWGFQLQTPWFVTVLIMLFLVMGLSLSGFIQLSGKWMGLGQNLTQGGGLKSSYFTGVLAAVVASPCTAPFMAPALGFALAQPWWLALSIFVSLGFGMALPFLLLSYVPDLHRYLPKPGAWMETFKQALAFPLYLTAIWLLWVLGRQIGIDAAIMVMMASLVIVFIYWLAKHSTAVQSYSSLLAVAVIALLSWNMSQQSTINLQTETNSTWETYSADRLQQLRQSGTPVFINMTADWCITCKVNEKIVFTEETLAAMKNKGIVLMKGDWTNYDADITQLLEQYGRGGVPLYLLYSSESNTEPKILSQILTPSGFFDDFSEI